MKISSHLLYLLPLAMGIGIAMSIQTALNTQLREYLYSPLQAALLSFLIGTIALAVLVFFQPVEKPNLETLLHIPWFLWLGGCLGVYAISISIYTAPKLGFLSLSGLNSLAAPFRWRGDFYWCASHFTTLRPHT